MMKLNKVKKYAAIAMCALAMVNAVPAMSVYAARGKSHAAASAGKDTAKMQDIAEKVQKAFEKQDLGKVAELCAYPVVISYANGELEEIPDKAGFMALGNSTVFSQKLLDAIASTNIAKLSGTGKGSVQMGEDYGLALCKINGKWKINNFILDSAKSTASDSVNVKDAAQMAELIQKTFSYRDLETLSKMCNYPVIITYADGSSVEYSTARQLMELGEDKVFTKKLSTAIDQTDIKKLQAIGNSGVQMGNSSGLNMYKFNGCWKINQIYQ